MPETPLEETPGEPVRAGGTVPCRVVVCRDCCCGTLRKHPDVDHDLLFEQLGVRTSGHAQVRASGCLLACEHSNVVVVLPSRLRSGLLRDGLRRARW